MIIHHFFTFPDWYVSGISYPYLSKGFTDFFCMPTKLCVSLFAFLTGWSYAYNMRKNYIYSFKKILKFLINYSIIFVPFTIIAIKAGKYMISKKTLYDFLGLGYDIMPFCWYVYFYIASMLILPLLYRLLDRSFKSGILYGVILPIAICFVLEWLHVPNKYHIMDVLDSIKYWFPITSVGYLFARYNIFSRIFVPNCKALGLNKKWIYIIAFLIAFVGRHYILFAGQLTFDIFFAPLAIFAIVNLTSSNLRSIPTVILEFLGKQSLNIWFLHNLFFNCTKEIFQKFAYAPHNPILVVIWVLVLTSMVSVGINYLMVPINKLFNRS